MKENLVPYSSKHIFIRRSAAKIILTVVVTGTLVFGMTSCSSSGGLFAPAYTATPAVTSTPQPTPTPAGISPDQDLAAVIEAAADGETIYLAPGVFTLERGIEITKSLTLSGSGYDQTTIIANGPGLNYSAMITYSGSGTLTLRGIKISYTGSDPAAVIFGNSGSLSLIDCYIDGATLSSQGKQLGALHLANDTVTSIRNCRIAGSTNRASPDKDEKVPGGILIYGNARLTMENSEVFDSYLGIYAHGTADITVKDSKIRNTYSGITLLENAKGLIHKNTFENNSKVHLTFFDNSLGTITENSISGSPESLGIQINESSNVLVEKNIIKEVMSGIIFLDSSTGDAISNELSSFSNSGIVIDGTTAPNLEGNTFTNDFQGIGILYQGSSTGTASRNIITNLFLGISLAEQAAPLLDSNDISNCETGIAYQDESAGTANQNSIILGSYGILINSKAMPTITNNTIQAYTEGLSSRPEDWINQLTVSGNTIEEGAPEVVIYTVTPAP